MARGTVTVSVVDAPMVRDLLTRAIEYVGLIGTAATMREWDHPDDTCWDRVQPRYRQIVGAKELISEIAGVLGDAVPAWEWDCGDEYNLPGWECRFCSSCNGHDDWCPRSHEPMPTEDGA